MYCRALTYFALIIVLSCLPLRAAGDAEGSGDIQRLTQNIRQQLLQVSPAERAALEKKGQDALRTMQGDGSWADQTYSDTDRIHWKCIDHLPRLDAIVKAYYLDDAHPPETLHRIVASLQFWLEKDPHNTNWWWNEIGVPMRVGNILMMMGSDAPQNLRDRGAELMKRAKWEGQTGANLTDETWIQVMRGCISNDPKVVAQAYARTWKEVRIVSAGAEGIQADYSFHQHGPLLYNQGYGAVFLSDFMRFVENAQGTSFIPPPKTLEIIDRLVLDGDLWMIRDGTWDWGVGGRGTLTRKGATSGGGIRHIAEQLAKIPGEDQKELAQDAGPEGNRDFWRSDYMVQRRPGYFVSMRMLSTRVANTDALINGENKKSHHVADGATCLMVSGKEYADIFPVWDWLKIPGTTIEQDTPLIAKSVRRMGATKFAGGVSDGKYGCAAMDLATGKLHARKAWFCFDDEIVCLGAGIDCPTENPVDTTLNQCLLNGKVSGDSGELAAGDHDLRAAHWIWHDSIGYVFPSPTDLHVKIASQKGAWSEIGSGSDEPVARDVFSAWIDHGKQTHDGSYAYILVPGSTVDQTKAEAAKLPVQIIANTPDQQAVWHGGLGLLEAVFIHSGEIQAGGMHISVDHPCLLMLKRNGADVELVISNPENAAETVNVHLSLALQGKDVQAVDNGSTVQIVLPGGEYAGRSVVGQYTVR